MKITLRRLAFFLLTLVLLASGGYILRKQLDYQKGARSYEAALHKAGIPRYIQAPVKPEEDGAPDPLEALLSSVDLAALREVNPDVVGWIVIPDTVLSYPVLQGRDNSYYLNHTWDRERSAVGAIFMEYTCAPDFSGFHTIIYGHRMNDESMFGVLHGYREMDFWRDHPAVYLVTDGGVRTYDVFAAHEVGIKEIVYRLDVEEKGWQQKFIDFCLERSVLSTGVAPAPEDQVLTLSTCTSRGHATRWVVQAVLRRI